MKTDQEFLSSADYRYIEGFAREFGQDAQESQLVMLRSLLARAGWTFDPDQIKAFLNAQCGRRLDEEMESRVFSAKPTSPDAAIRAFLEFYDPLDLERV